MITDKIKHLNSVREKFQPYIDNPNLVYTFVAPLNKDLFERFFRLVSNVPTGSSSIYEVLNNETFVTQLLVDNFDSNTDLEIYTATNDTMTSIFSKGLLKNYILQKKLHFDY